MEGDGALGALDSEGEVAPLGPVLDDHAELLRARVLLHVLVEEARLAHGELVAYGDVALQLGGSVLELQNRHARAVDRLDLR